MQVITVSGPPSAGKTSVILKAAACLRDRGCTVGVVKFDCLYTDDDQLYAAAGFPAKKALSRELCPDHFFISNIEDAYAWGEKKNLDYLITESAGLCNRCSPHIRRIMAVCVVDQLSGIRTPAKIGPMLRLAAQYKVLEHEYTRRNAPQPLSPEAQAERDAAHRLLNCCMREGDLDALKRLALKGEKPDDSVAIRHGLAEGYRRLEELSREWNEEMRGDNHTIMEQIELREADERGRLMRQAAALYERKTGGRLPGDYLEAVKAERALLHGLARHGWDGQREVPKETVEKYGLTEDFAGIARLRWDYHLSEDNGDLSRDYPEAAIGSHNRAIRERAAKELAGLEARLFPEKAASRERKAAHLRADNRASPTASLKRERKEPPGKRQAGETDRRKPPVRRIRM